MEETTFARSRARWKAFALVGVFSLVLVQLVLATAPASAVPPGDELFGADGAGGTLSSLYKINPATGARTDTIGEIGFSVTGLAFDPTTGQLYGSTTSNDPEEPGSLIRINTTTGAGTLVGASGTTIIPACDTGTADITFTTDGSLYGWTECSDDLVLINKATGVGAVVGPSGIGSFGSGLSADPDDNTLWLTPDGGNGPIWTVNRTTGVATAGPTLNGANSNSINSLAWSSDGEMLFGTYNGTGGEPGPRNLITINTTTGAITTIGPSDHQQDAIAWRAAPPAPPCKGKTPTIVGTTGNDVLAGTAGNDVIAGQGGNDRISALGGNDTVCAGGGNDKVLGRGGNDRLLGQAGNDNLKGAGGKDNLRGGGGKDTCNGGPGRDKGNCETEKSIP